MAAWHITRSTVEDAERRPVPESQTAAVDILGPRTATADEVARLTLGREGFAFRLLDDDGTVYYWGRCLAEDFSPLDDYGTPNAGATTIQYRNEATGAWETL